MPSKKYYEIYKTNPEYMEKERIRKNNYNLNKYRENDEYMEMKKEYQRNYNRNKKIIV